MEAVRPAGAGPARNGMHIVVVGIDQPTAGHLGLTAADFAARLDPPAAQAAGWREGALLATCHRLEYYAVTELEAPSATLVAALRQWLPAALAGHGYGYADRAAARHLARVAAGLEARVVGETQILGQVSAAYAAARAQGTAGPGLAALFAAAVRAGKRVRTETDLSRGAQSLSAVAVHMAARQVPDLAAARVLVLGAGTMATLAVKALHGRGARHVTLLNRTQRRAEALAARWHMRAGAWEHLAAELAEAEVVLAATAAPQVVVTAAQVAAAMRHRPARPLLLVDLAVPPAIAPEAGQVPGVRWLPLDALDVDWHNQAAARQAAVPAAEALVEMEAEAFERRRAGWGVSQVIGAMRAKAEAIRQAEVARTLRRLPHLSGEERGHVEALAQALLNRLLHEPTTRLRARAGGSAAAHYSATVRDLFGLEAADGLTAAEASDL